MNIAHEYRGFNYTNNGGFVLFMETKPFIRFERLVLLENFVDNVINTIEQVPLFQDFQLHLTGCARCRRTANGDKFDPCETGKPKFIHAKSVTMHVFEALAQAVEETRPSYKEESKKLSEEAE